MHVCHSVGVRPAQWVLGFKLRLSYSLLSSLSGSLYPFLKSAPSVFVFLIIVLSSFSNSGIKCVCVCARASMHCGHVEARGHLWVLCLRWWPPLFLLCFWDGVSHLAWCSLLRQEPSCLHVYSPGNKHHLAPSPASLCRDQAQVLMLVQQGLYQLSNLSSPLNICF